MTRRYILCWHVSVWTVHNAQEIVIHTYIHLAYRELFLWCGEPFRQMDLMSVSVFCFCFFENIHINMFGEYQALFNTTEYINSSADCFRSVV